MGELRPVSRALEAGLPPAAGARGRWRRFYGEVEGIGDADARPRCSVDTDVLPERRSPEHGVTRLQVPAQLREVQRVGQRTFPLQIARNDTYSPLEGWVDEKNIFGGLVAPTLRLSSPHLQGVSSLLGATLVPGLTTDVPGSECYRASLIGREDAPASRTDALPLADRRIGAGDRGGRHGDRRRGRHHLRPGRRPQLAPLPARGSASLCPS
jgi:hypothetical protein